MAKCPDVKHMPRSKGSSSYDSNDRFFVKIKSSIYNINANINDNEDKAYFNGLTRTIINKNVDLLKHLRDKSDSIIRTLLSTFASKA
jgi:hypothetical protein